MSSVVRRAGRVNLPGGDLLVWSVADGRRGRRWRAVISRDDRLVESLLLEVGGDGRPTRLELTNAAGLLTLHPEPFGELHGNVVTPAGMRHLALAWNDDHELAADRLPIAAAVTAHRLSRVVPVGEGREVSVVAVTEELEALEEQRRYRRISETTWRIEGGDEVRDITIDDRGLLTWPDRGGEPAEWPLEVHPGT